jgi:hypothetical protein
MISGIWKIPTYLLLCGFDARFLCRFSEQRGPIPHKSARTLERATATTEENCGRRRRRKVAYVKAHSLSLSQAVVRLDGQYGNGAIVADLAGLSYVMRGKDYDLLDLESVQARLTQPPDQQTSHPETGTCRALFDFPDLSLSPIGPRTRVIVATHPATETEAKIGITRGKVVYELFYTALPQAAFTPADVVDLSLFASGRV